MDHVKKWHVKRIIGNHETSTVAVINERQDNGRHVCFTSFNDGSLGWWPFGERGFLAKTFSEACESADRYLATGKVPKRKKDKKVTLESVPEEEDS